MGRISGLMRRIGMLVTRNRFRQDLDEEMAFHREQAQRQFESEGMSPRQAQYAARREFGNPMRLKEQSQEEIGFRFETIAQDIRYALRQLWLNPGFTMIITVTLALSIGANSAIFSVINAVLLKSLPYTHPEQLIRLFLTTPAFPQFPINPWDFHDLRDHSRSFESMAAYTRSDLQLSGSGDPVRLYGFAVTSGYFHTLGLRPQVGHEFNYKAEVPGNGMQVILSDRLWRSRFAADPQVVGRKLTLNMLPYTIVGVMPARTAHPGNSYRSVAYGSSVDLWVPFTFEGSPANRGSHYLDVIGRLRPGMTAQQAQDELNSVMNQVSPNFKATRTSHLSVSLLAQEVVGANRTMLLMLLGAVGMVLLIACTNAANLQLARASARQRELSIRLALGASRGRVIRQLLTESVLIAFLAGALGSLLAVGGVRVLVSMLPADFPRADEIHVDATVFTLTLLVSALTGIVFGLMPALQSSRGDVREGLHEGSRGTTGSRQQNRLRNALVISEISLACVLLAGAGLMLRSFLNQLDQNIGFERDHVLTATLSLPHSRYDNTAAISSFFNRLVGNLSSQPGVASAGIGSDLPWTGYNDNSGFNIEGKQSPPGDGFHARYHFATPGYFRALGIPLMEGRFFSDADMDKSPRVLLVNQALATAYWPGEDVVGKRITFSDAPKEADWIRIVGVVGDVKDTPSSKSAAPAFWWPLVQGPYGVPEMSLVIRSNSDSAELADVVRNEVRKIDPQLAVADIRLMDQIVDRSISRPRFLFFLVSLFAGLAILLAAIGIYGVIAYSVSQRMPEFGLRLALGAAPRDLLHSVIIQAARLALAGTVAGVIAALLLGRLVRSLIYNVSAADPVTFVVVAAAVLVVAILAGYVPARRATHADPMRALRAE